MPASKIQLQLKHLASPPVSRWPYLHKWKGRDPINDTIPASRDSAENIWLPGTLWSQSTSFPGHSSFPDLHAVPMTLPCWTMIFISLPHIFYLSFLVVFYLSHLYFSWAKPVVLQKSVVGFCIDLHVFMKPLKKNSILWFHLYCCMRGDLFSLRFFFKTNSKLFRRTYFKKPKRFSKL